jgi:hypothetical protein
MLHALEAPDTAPEFSDCLEKDSNDHKTGNNDDEVYRSGDKKHDPMIMGLNRRGELLGLGKKQKEGQSGTGLLHGPSIKRWVNCQSHQWHRIVK